MLKYHAQFLLDKEKNQDSAKIRYRVKWHGNITSFNIGYRVEIKKWSTEVQRCKNNTTHGKKKVSASIINKRIQQYQDACEELFAGYALHNKVPDKKGFRVDFQKKIGKQPKKLIDESFFEVFDRFMQEESVKNQWTNSTKKKFKSIKNHLLDFDDKLALDKLTEEKLIEYQCYMQKVLAYKNSTLIKNLSFVKWFLKWTIKKGFNTHKAFETFKPKLKHTKKKIIFLTLEELRLVKNFRIPKDKKYLEEIRDVFLFQCFTSLRFSDVENLKRSDVKANHIEVTTLKTTDSLIIELNKHSRAILKKYEKEEFANDKVLPVISNQKTNKHLKELMLLIGIDEPIRETYYIGNKRFDEVTPKYNLISTHAGRRTFICSALALGVPPQVVMKWTGHADYSAMKPYIDIADSIKANAMEKFDLI